MHNAQVFRSIDSQCVVGFPKDNNEAYDRGLVTGGRLGFVGFQGLHLGT